MSFRVDIGDITANVANLWYILRLNGPATYEFSTDGNEVINFAELVSGKTVSIYNDTTRDVLGKSKKVKRYHGGGAIVSGFGQEREDLGKAKCPVDSGKHTKTWTSTTDHTILAAIISGSGWTADVANSSATTYDSFRVNDSMSMWSGIMSMLRHGGKDIKLDYETSKIYLYDALNTNTDWAYISGQNCGAVVETRDEPVATKIVVYGKGDGENQIIGTSGSGTPILAITDKNIITTTEANTRAAAELAKIVSETIHYSFSPNSPLDAVVVGDTVSLTEPTMNIDDESLDVVKVKRGLRNGTEFLELEVATQSNRTASKTVEELKARSEMRNINAFTSMQGSLNYNTWPGMINADSTAPLIIEFNVSQELVEDEAGNMRVNTLTLDYDIDPYRRGVGDATESNKEPDIASGTYSGSDNESTEIDDDTNYNNSITFADSWTGYKTWSNIPQHGEAIIFHISLWVLEWNTAPASAHSAYVRILHDDLTDYYPSSTGVRLLRGPTEYDTSEDTHFHGPTSGVFFVATDDCDGNYDYCSTGTATDTHDHVSRAHLNGTATIYIPIDPYLQDFIVQMDHSDSGNALAGFFAAYYVASQHKHGNGDYKTDAHKHDVAVGDSVSDAGSVNATEISEIKLQFWNVGGSSWDTKVTISNTGKTLDTDVDLTDSDTYPDATGLWRVSILTDSASPDLVNGIVKIKNNLEN